MLGFVLLTSLAYPLLICVWGQVMPQLMKPNINYRIGSNGHLNTRIKEIPLYTNVDILIMGSSHAYRGFDTRIFESEGFRTFNLGSSGQTPINGKVLLERYLDSLNPKLIIYEVYPGSFNSDGVESSLDIIANDQNDIASIEMAFAVNHLKTYNTLIYGFYRDVFGLDKDFKEEKVKKEDSYITGGYVIKENWKMKAEEFDSRNWNLSGKQFEAFEKNVELIKSRDIELIFVKAPITKQLYEAFTDNEEYDARMSRYGPYYNFNKLVDLVDKLHFNDSHHLNHDGVKVFNQKLIEIIPLNEYLD